MAISATKQQVLDIKKMYNTKELGSFLQYCCFNVFIITITTTVIIIRRHTCISGNNYKKKTSVNEQMLKNIKFAL